MSFRRILLIPISYLYGCITWIRNQLYDYRILPSYQPKLKSICIGNLRVGGTGKTPHVAFLHDFMDHRSPAIISRGYGRKVRGMQLVTNDNIASEVGDEPLMYRKRFNWRTTIMVAERRHHAVEFIETNLPKVRLLIFDDAFQHRSIKAGFNIVITDYFSPFWEDKMMPYGRLREYISGVKRAQCIIISKCPSTIPKAKKIAIEKALAPYNIPYFYSRIKYKEFVCFGKEQVTQKRILLVTGIANPTPLVKYLKKQFEVEELHFPDHYNFTSSDIEQIHRKFDTFAQEESILLTTEKDFVRLESFSESSDLKNYPWYYVPISVQLEYEKNFKKLIYEYVRAI